MRNIPPEKLKVFIEHGDHISTKIHEYRVHHRNSLGLMSMTYHHSDGTTYFSIEEFEYFEGHKNFYTSPLMKALL
jgi:hypothetical protein